MTRRHPARHWHRDRDKIVCTLCPHLCRIGEGGTGICRGRRVSGGELIAENYGLAPSLALDPVEKKPLYHFKPGAAVLSLGPVGCNLRCDFCQNWQISQQGFPTRKVRPEDLVRQARDNGAAGIAYTYTEPLIWFEFVMDCAAAFREAGLSNIMVSNGFVNPEPLAELLPLVDAWNIDLKSIRSDFYKRICGGRLEPVLATIQEADKVALVELTNLIIPGENDSDRDLHDLVDWVAEQDRTMPLHFSRYHPSYQSDRPPTPASTLQKAYEIANESLDYVYLGNISISGADTTWCPSCGQAVVERTGFGLDRMRLDGDRCSACGHRLRIVV